MVQEPKTETKQDNPPKQVNRDELFEWAFGYSEANTPKSRMASRWAGLHPNLGPYPGMKKVKQLYQERKNGKANKK